MGRVLMNSRVGFLSRAWSTVSKRLPQMVGIGSVIVSWWGVTHFNLVGSTLMATPHEVLEVLTQSSSEGKEVWRHALHTFKRAVQGWFLALVVGTVVGLVVGSWHKLFIGSEPLVEFFRSVPPVILFPLLLVAFNYEVGSYVWTIAVGCLPVMVLAVGRRLQEIPQAKVEFLEIYEVGPLARITVMIMETVPGIFFGARIMLSIAIVIAVVTEMVVAPNTPWALGAFAEDALMAFQTPNYFASVLLIGGFGYVSNLGLRLIEGRIGGDSERPHARIGKGVPTADFDSV